MRLIDMSGWDAFFNDMTGDRNMYDHYDNGYTDAMDNADDWIDAQPTIDAVPVVRCKDCERRDKSADLTNTVYCLWWSCSMGKTDFCSYGERKDGENHD